MAELTFTGERFLPRCAGEIAYEHWHRYAFARRFVAGKRVLDAACGEGYGTSLLGEAAASVIGVDIDGVTVAHALARYGDGGRKRFVEGACARLPLPDASFDVVVSFETVEHLDAADQPRMIAEFDRVLAPDGILIISSPNKKLYSDARHYINEFHQHELYRDEFVELLQRWFPAQQWHDQRLATWSGIWAEEPGPAMEAWLGDANGVEEYIVSEGMYFVVVAARSQSSLPPAALRASLFTDAEDSVGKQAEENAREVLRLDALLKESNLGLERQERLIGERDGQLAELGAVRDDAERRLADRVRAVAALEGEVARLHGEVMVREVEISYRQSFRWWLRLPWVRIRLLLANLR
jgi:SAM-dependent methyltransferase